MKVLIGWDNPEEADLIGLYLNVDENEAEVVCSADDLRDRATNEKSWDIILFAIDSDDIESSFQLFTEIRRLLPETPAIAACRMTEMIQIARFLTNGLRTYIVRDDNGDYMFLLQTTMESIISAVKAEREQLIASKLREEIDSVRKLQESIIPNRLDCPSGYSVCARYESSQISVVGGRPVTMAGGDYYDVFTLPDGSIVLLVGDASGHGMKACMSIMAMHTLVHMIRGDEYRDTASFVAEVNRRLCDQTLVTGEGGFITMLYGILKPDTEEFQWTSAGHPIPMVHHLETNEIEMLGGIDDGGLPIAVYDEAEYDVYTNRIPPNSRLLIYTDGLEEAFPAGMENVHDQYGIPGIKNTLRESRSRTLEETLEALFDDSSAYTQGAGRHDDTSVVLVERRG